MNKNRFWLAPRITWLIVGSLLAFSVILFFTARQTSAYAILDKAKVSIPPIQEGTVYVHWQNNIYQRVNPSLTEPPDPYHKPLPEKFSDSTTSEAWLKIENGRVAQSHSIDRDVLTGTILFEIIFDGKQRIIYDSSGYLSYIPVEDEIPQPYVNEVPFLEYAQENNLKITGSMISPWGKEAWIIEGERTADLKEILDSYDEASKPYLTDLKVNAFYYKWLVDKESEQLAVFEWQAITPAESVVLERINYGMPAILGVSNLPTNWLLPSVPNAPTIGNNEQPETLSRDLEETLSLVNFPVLLPKPAPESLTRIEVVFNPNPEPRPELEQTWVFDIQDAPSHGLGLAVMYLSENSTDAFVIIQGPSGTLVPLMKQMPAFWTESHSRDATVDHEGITIWIATGGPTDIPPKQVIVMFEKGDLFFFVVGQGYSEEETLEFIKRFQPSGK